jgi:hypothetical protein
MGISDTPRLGLELFFSSNISIRSYGGTHVGNVSTAEVLIIPEIICISIYLLFFSKHPKKESQKWCHHAKVLVEEGIPGMSGRTSSVERLSSL